MQVKSIAECSTGSILQYFSTFIKLPVVIKIFVLSIFEWPFYTNFTVSQFFTHFIIPRLSNPWVISWPSSLYSKTCVKSPFSKRPKIGFQDQLSLNAGQKYCRMLQEEHSAILLTSIKLTFIIKIFVLSFFEWPFYTGFTVSQFFTHFIIPQSSNPWVISWPIPIPSSWYSKTCVKRPLSKRPNIGFQDQLSLNAGQKYCKCQEEHSAILSTYIKLPIIIKIFLLSIFE